MEKTCGSVASDDKSTRSLPKASVNAEATRKSPPDIPRIAGERMA
jgi:hypothetical protein